MANTTFRVIHRLPAPGNDVVRRRPRRAGMGDWKGDIAGMVAGGDLDRLTKAIFGVQDQLIDAIQARNGILDGYTKATALYNQAVADFGQPYLAFGMPNPYTLPAMVAVGTAGQGARTFARQVQTLSELSIVFSIIANELGNAGLANDANSVQQTVNQVNRFVIETDQRFAGVREYTATKMAIIDAFKQEMAAFGVGSTAYSDPRWFAAYVVAADKVVPLPGRPTAPAEAGVAGMGTLGNPLAQVAVVLIWVIAIIAFTVVLMHTINRMIPDQNSKAETARKLILQRDQAKTDIIKQMVAQGKTQAEIDEFTKSYDAGTKKGVEDIPEPGSPLGGLVAPIAAVIALAIGAKVAGVI